MFREKLRKHQIEGLKFLWEHSGKNEGGCILADYMGLGKTLQVCCFILLYKSIEENKNKSVLILAPKSVNSHWIREFNLVNTWLASQNNSIKISPILLNANDEDSERLKIAEKWKKEGGVLITTYDLFRNLVTFNQQFYEHMSNPGADIVILDEGDRKSVV